MGKPHTFAKGDKVAWRGVKDVLNDDFVQKCMGERDRLGWKIFGKELMKRLAEEHGSGPFLVLKAEVVPASLANKAGHHQWVTIQTKHGVLERVSGMFFNPLEEK